MRITLDHNAMQVLLDNMSEDAKLDFSNKVVAAVVERFARNITEDRVRKILDGECKNVIEETVKGSFSNVELTGMAQHRLKEAVEKDTKKFTDKAITDLRRKVYEADDEIKRLANERVEEVLNHFARRHVKDAVNQEVREQVSRMIATFSEPQDGE